MDVYGTMLSYDMALAANGHHAQIYNKLYKLLIRKHTILQMVPKFKYTKENINNLVVSSNVVRNLTFFLILSTACNLTFVF